MVRSLAAPTAQFEISGTLEQGFFGFHTTYSRPRGKAALNRRFTMDTKPDTLERDVEKEYELRAFIEELRRLADALEKGEPFEIEVDGETVSVPASAKFSVEHERSGEEDDEEDAQVEEELEFQLKWTVS